MTRGSAAVLGMVLACLPALAGCGHGDSSTLGTQPSPSPVASNSPVPPAYRPACGHPGAVVNIGKTTDVIKHSDCDLRGVNVHNPGIGVQVPSKPGGTSGNGDATSGKSWTLDVAVAPNLDVTVTSS